MSKMSEQLACGIKWLEVRSTAFSTCLRSNWKAPDLQCVLCRCTPGCEAPEVADEFQRLGHYNHRHTHDMWAYGMLLLEIVGIEQTAEHIDAKEASRQGDVNSTRAFARSLLNGQDYYELVGTLVTYFNLPY